MSSKIRTQLTACVALDHNTAAMLVYPNPEAPPMVGYVDNRYTLKVMAASTFEDQGGVMPAESITIGGESVAKLRDLLMEHVKGPLGTDYSMPQLSQLMADGFSLMVSIPTAHGEPELTKEKLTKAMKLLNSAGFNIRTLDEGEHISGKLSFEAYPIS